MLGLVESEPAQSMPLTGVSGHAGSLCHTAGVLLSPLTLQELHRAPPSGHPRPLQQLGKGFAQKCLVGTSLLVKEWRTLSLGSGGDDELQQ